ncbi:matrix metalloproteinase-2-like isoform X1 [Centruroides sculpturatus]|uniref:matrix metalloproteinase-2-like isoform X1 n=2 Tax=Centruroides sculpturatus TaxID=218467 RepID=UPI000C6E61A4|nr:matrix metalloproteinase-2-like isoform X1 [Centruroides sculpturatus]
MADTRNTFLLLFFVVYVVTNATRDHSLQQIVDFLSRFGYLSSSKDASELRSDSELRKAILRMQMFGNVPQTGVIDDATLSLLNRKRCGVSDGIGNWNRNKRYAIQGQAWATNNLTWSLQGGVKNMNGSTIRKQLIRAFEIWSEASSLVFHEVNSSKADIVIDFPRGSHGDGYPFDGHGSILAHAFFPGDGIGGDAHFDADEKWVVEIPHPESDEVNFFAVAAHELGHSLGLSHSSVPGSLMFPYYQEIKDDYKLPQDDVSGIEKLYGPKSRKKWKQTTTKAPPKMQTSTVSSRSTESSQNNRVPDRCNTTFDAISVIRREVFVFKGKYFWRLHRHKVRRGYPVRIDRFWYNLPENLKRIDAVYERPTDSKIVFFSGNKYWLFDANQPEPGYPRPLTDLGLAANIRKIDAAMVWSHNKKTYFFSGRRYWRFDEDRGKVESDYPRDMSVWRGIPYNIDAAFRWTDGNYFLNFATFFDTLRQTLYPTRRG